MASSADRHRAAFGAVLAVVAAGAGAAPELLRPLDALDLPGAWVTAADLLPAAARRHAALADVRVAPLPACAGLSLPWARLAQALERAFPGRYRVATDGATQVRQHGSAAPAWQSQVQQALDLACGGAGHCVPAEAPPAAPCLPQGRTELRARVAPPRVEAGVAVARLQAVVDGAVQATWSAPVRWQRQPAWRLRAPLQPGQALSLDDLEPSWAAPDAAARPLHYEPASGVLRAAAELPAGQPLPAAVQAFAARARAGDTISAVARLGDVRVQRRVELAADAAPGRAAWARLPDGRLMPLQPAQAGRDAGWEVLP